MRYTLRDLMVAVALVAVACAVAKYVATGGEPMLKLAGIFAVPLLLGSAVDQLCGRVGLWIRVGMFVDTAILGLMVLWLMMI